ncbi:uncharacterized protein I206_104754 [Kwoniella pini CBS 10737]|uniref:Aminoglycoside phosphotransferase domain-containing protein n=1 Tax=Kwoniella pini CBS 10737 TaxID=1296096 RepID=A0A1B9I7N3_9TREE|nr:uncharacterized protein I206_02292 [Kwoniella pini CBS 10737]OCF51577.1 hypothetical protein I206_02292 [Kwoniella pini CBS 10737]
MKKSAQPYIKLTNCRRRFFEAYSPSAGCRLFLKRSATREEATKKLNRAGAPADALVQRSYTSLQNEALAIHWIGQNTNIPVPKVFAAYEDRGCFYLIQEYVEDCIPAFRAAEHLHPYIVQQLEGILEELHRCRSSVIHSFTKQLHLPARMANTKTYLSHLQYPEDPGKERYVLCHGDLGWQNIMVDPESGQIKAIIDWEFAGFWPIEIEGEYWRRRGTASAYASEVDDVDAITDLLYNLSKKGHFEESYKSPHVEDMERSPFTREKLLRPRSSHSSISLHTAKTRSSNSLSHKVLDDVDQHFNDSKSRTSHNSPLADNHMQQTDSRIAGSSGAVQPASDPAAPNPPVQSQEPSLPTPKKKWTLAKSVKRLLKPFLYRNKATNRYIHKSNQESTGAIEAAAQHSAVVTQLPQAEHLPEHIGNVEGRTSPPRPEMPNLTPIEEVEQWGFDELSFADKNLNKEIVHWTNDEPKGDLEGDGSVAKTLESCDVPEWKSLQAVLPDDRPVTSRTLAVEVAMAARRQLSKQAATMQRTIQMDTHATKDWLAAVVSQAPEYYIYQQYSVKPRLLYQESLHLVELNTLLEKSLKDLSQALLESSQALGKFQNQQLIDIAHDQERIKLDPNFANKAHKFVPPSVFKKAKWTSSLEQEGDIIKRDIHGDRDEAFRESETLKWKAILKAAEEIILVAHAADCLLPYLPDREKNQKSRFRDPARGVTEDKARDLLLGGTGGWAVKVEDVSDWVPIDHNALGVPEDDTQHRDQQVSYNEKMIGQMSLPSTQSHISMPSNGNEDDHA